MLYPNELRAQNNLDFKHISRRNKIIKSGRGREIRTPDILLPKQARYQAALYPDYPHILNSAPISYVRGGMIRRQLEIVNCPSVLFDPKQLFFL